MIKILSIICFVLLLPACNTLVVNMESGNNAEAKANVEKGADIEEYNGAYGTPLMQAARHNNVEMTKYLLEKGADVNHGVMNNGSYLSPLGYAVGYNSVAVAKLLLAHGADPTVRSTVKNYTLQEVAQKQGYQAMVNLLRSYETQKADWDRTEKNNTIKAYQRFIKKYPDSLFRQTAQKKITTLDNAESALAVIKTKENTELRKIKTLDGYYQYLKSKPDAHNRQDVLKLMVGEIGKSKNIMKEYERLYRFDKAAIAYFPADLSMQYSLLEIGPDNMKVRDIKNGLKNGVSSNLMASKIRATIAPYKNFNFKEIKILKQIGLTEGTITAMIDANTAFQKKLQAEKQNKELMAQIKKALDASRQSVTSDVVKEDAGNTPIECLKLKAALKACDSMGGFARMACEVTAKSSFDCTIVF